MPIYASTFLAAFVMCVCQFLHRNMYRPLSAWLAWPGLACLLVSERDLASFPAQCDTVRRSIGIYVVGVGQTFSREFCTANRVTKENMSSAPFILVLSMRTKKMLHLYGRKHTSIFYTIKRCPSSQKPLGKV